MVILQTWMWTEKDADVMDDMVNKFLCNIPVKDIVSIKHRTAGGDRYDGDPSITVMIVYKIRRK